MVRKADDPELVAAFEQVKRYRDITIKHNAIMKETKPELFRRFRKDYKKSLKNAERYCEIFSKALGAGKTFEEVLPEIQKHARKSGEHSQAFAQKMGDFTNDKS